jgi:MFS family permease
MRADVAIGLRYVVGHCWLRSIAATTGISNFFGNVLGAILILYLTQERGLSAAAIGLAVSVGSVGVLAAALSTNAITRRLGVGRVLVLAAVGFSVAGLPVAFAPDELTWSGVTLSGFLAGFCGVAWNINQVSLRQAITPPRMQGRMNATMRFIVWGTIPLGAIAGGILGDLIGLEGAIWVGAIGGLVAFLPVALSSVRHLVRIPEPVDDEPGAGAAAPA